LKLLAVASPTGRLSSTIWWFRVGLMVGLR
jgi:hypothetical protein